MKKAKTASTTIEVKVGRYNESTQILNVPAGSSVADVLEKANISVSSEESIWVDGEEASGTDTVEDGDNLAVVGKKEGANEQNEATNDEGEVNGEAADEDDDKDEKKPADDDDDDDKEDA